MKAENKNRTWEELFEDAWKLCQGFSKQIDTLEQQKKFVQGLGLGLLFGIVGNIFVSHYYGFFEDLVKGNFNGLFSTNLFIVIISLISIFVLIVKWSKDTKDLEKKQEPLIDNLNKALKVLEESLAKR